MGRAVGLEAVLLKHLLGGDVVDQSCGFEPVQTEVVPCDLYGTADRRSHEACSLGRLREPVAYVGVLEGTTHDRTEGQQTDYAALRGQNHGKRCPRIELGPASFNHLSLTLKCVELLGPDRLPGSQVRPVCLNRRCQLRSIRHLDWAQHNPIGKLTGKVHPPTLPINRSSPAAPDKSATITNKGGNPGSRMQYSDHGCLLRVHNADK